MKVEKMNFESALPILKAGNKIVRSGWGGGEEYIKLLNQIFDSRGNEIEVTPYFLIKVKGEGFSMFSPTPCDVLAEDWVLVE